jgi:hypothetical protein
MTTGEVIAMIVKTRVFDLCDAHYRNLTELALTMEISVSQIYRIRQGKRSINQKFIVGAIKAFPQYKLDELFYLAPNSEAAAPPQVEVKEPALP